MSDDMTLAGGYDLRDVQGQLATTAAVYLEVCNARARDMAAVEASVFQRVRRIMRTGQITRLVESDGYRFVGRDGDREFSLTVPVGQFDRSSRERREEVGRYIMRDLRRRLLHALRHGDTA